MEGRGLEGGPFLSPSSSPVMGVKDMTQVYGDTV